METFKEQLKLFTLDNLGGGSFSPRDIPAFIFGLLLTALLTWLLGKMYIRYGHSLSNRRALSRIFILLGVTTMLIITVVKSSLALSLGLVGALSIVRFRAAIKEPEELAYLFITIAIGLGMGAGFSVLTCIAFAILCVLILALNRFWHSPVNQNMYISLVLPDNGKIPCEEAVEILKKHSHLVKLKRSDDTGHGSEATFFVEFDSLAELEESRKELNKMNPSLRITFMDTSGDY
ncbi:MAG: DUF4956 domain-containing protein [Bacteroidetes bacterium]|nr:DUF4956 domain-containing protein [Bacteroidota bacterium]